MNNYELFESYIFNKLSEDQIEEFENKISTDSDFKEDYEQHIQIQNALDILVEEDVASVIDGLKKPQTDMPNASSLDSDNIKTIVPKRWLGIAALVLFLFANFLSEYILKDNSLESLFRLFGSLLPLISLNFLVVYILNGKQKTCRPVVV